MTNKIRSTNVYSAFSEAIGCPHCISSLDVVAFTNGTSSKITFDLDINRIEKMIDKFRKKCGNE